MASGVLAVKANTLTVHTVASVIGRLRIGRLRRRRHVAVEDDSNVVVSGFSLAATSWRDLPEDQGCPRYPASRRQPK
jgi:hypothetical protein